MKISVIVPCLRRDALAEQCLDEIRRQAETGGAELHLVVIEGVSPYGRAINEGLSRSTGDYIAWVDADDMVLPGWWTSICQAVSSRPDVVILGWHDDRLSVDLIYEPAKTDSARNLFRSVLRDESPHSFLWNKVIRKDLWDNERFDERWLFQADFGLLPRVLNKVQTVISVNRPLYRYRFNSQSISHAETPSRAQEIFDVRWQRFEDWRGSNVVADALVPFVRHLAYRYETVVRGGGKLADDALLQRQVARLRECLSLVLCNRNIRWQERLKALFVLWGWCWPQRLFGK